jgi:hypothetical protein
VKLTDETLPLFPVPHTVKDARIANRVVAITKARQTAEEKRRKLEATTAGRLMVRRVRWYLIRLAMAGNCAVTADDMGDILDELHVGGDRRRFGSVFAHTGGLFQPDGHTKPARRHGAPIQCWRFDHAAGVFDGYISATGSLRPIEEALAWSM